MNDSLAITLRGMRFHALVGILPHERELAQPLEIDLTIWRREASSDAPVLDYRALYDAAASAIAAGPVGYIESLAHDVSERAFACGDVARVRVAVRKPHVALPGPLAHAEVVLDRSAAT
jgi:dihydroneopterin aldolase